MPLYEYRCEACGEHEERLEPLSAPETHACPECGAEQGMKRKLSVAAFSLNGGGWYKQGYTAGSKTESSPAPAASGGSCCAGGCACKG